MSSLRAPTHPKQSKIFEVMASFKRLTNIGLLRKGLLGFAMTYKDKAYCLPLKAFSLEFWFYGFEL
jgi:hypothetical protein